MALTKEKKRQLALVVIAGILFLGAGYYFGYRLINRARAQTDAKAQELHKKVEKMNKDIELGEAAQKKIEALRQKLKPYQDEMPPVQAETWLARATDTVANRHNLKLKGSRVVDPEPYLMEEFKGGSHFGLAGYAFSVQGTYFQLGEFLADLEGSHPLMVVDSIALQSGGGGAQHIHDMSVKISMVTEKQ